MKWFCMACMKDHESIEEVDACRCKRAEGLRSLTPEQIRYALNWSLTHPIEFDTPSPTEGTEK